MKAELDQIPTVERESTTVSGGADSRVIVSLSAIPARFGSLPKCIDSLLRQTRSPDQIVVNIPRYYKRFQIEVSDSELPVLEDSRVIINRCEDCGPGTKLLGSMDLLRKGDLVVLVDDDLGYDERLLEELIECSVAGDCAASFHVYEVAAGSKHDIGQGADGFAIPFSSLSGIELYFKLIAGNHHLFLNDDLWISFFLEMKGVRIANCAEYQIDRGRARAMVPGAEVLTKAEGLVDIQGRYSRWRSVYRGIRYLERKRPWLEASAGIRETVPRFSPMDLIADIFDRVRR